MSGPLVVVERVLVLVRLVALRTLERTLGGVAAQVQLQLIHLTSNQFVNFSNKVNRSLSKTHSDKDSVACGTRLVVLPQPEVLN